MIDLDTMPPQPDDPIDWLDAKPTHPDALDAALKYSHAGLSVVPCLMPSKRPPFGWLMYQAEIADEKTIQKWYHDDQSLSVGVVCGEVSGGLEVIDLDGGAFAESYNALIRANMPGLLEKLVIEQSPSGGMHYAYRCEEVEGNTPIAKTTKELPGHKRGADGLTTLIETRGHGGYIVTYPTRGYEIKQGDWSSVPTISREERSLLWSCAAILDESDKTPATPQAQYTPDPLEIPASANDFHSLLERHGWTLARSAKGREEWRRPGKTDGISATWNYLEDRFYVFSSNAAPLKENHCYTIKQVQHLLEPDNVPLKDRPITEKIYLTDAGNARRFMLRFNDQFRHVKSWGWMHWTGKKWELDSGKRVMQAAHYTVMALFDEARDASNPEDVKAIGKWALSSQSSSKMDALVKVASNLLELEAQPDQFDSNPFLINCDNGIVDLSSGILMEHDHSAMLSKISGSEYRADAKCPKWESFINRIMDGNEALIKFLQRAVGYSLTGSTTEQCFFLAYGTGANGKSVFLETMRAMLNDYATTAEFSTFLAKQNETVRNDIAALAGARFVASSESGADKRLSEVIIKALTGGDTITARFLFQEYFQFRPQFKVWMATNHKPVIKDTDHAIWRRVRLIPFSVTIPEAERNQKLTEELKEEYPGILAWAVRGCIDWIQNGLGTPAEVIDATESYRDDMDIMSQFIEDCCKIGDEFTTLATPIYSRYCSWCELNNEKPMSQREFGLRLSEKGYTKERSGKGNKYTGIGLIDE